MGGRTGDRGGARRPGAGHGRQVFSDSQVLARRALVVDVEHPTIGPVRVTGVPFKLAATPASVRTPPPLLGEHTDEVLAWLGYDAAATVALRQAKVV